MKRAKEWVRVKTLIRFGEVMVDVFAPHLEFKIDRRQNEVPYSRLAAGPGEAKAGQNGTP